MVFGVNSNDDIFYRAGISPSSPAGAHWARVPGKLSQIDTHENVVVGANSVHNTFSLTITRTPGYRGDILLFCLVSALVLVGKN